MTPLPTPEELLQRWIYDPDPETIHIKDLGNMNKDGLYVKDKISDYLIGILIIAVEENMIERWVAETFQLPFVEDSWGQETPDIRLRKKCSPVGNACKGPDGKILILLGRKLAGSDLRNLDPSRASTLTKETIKLHEGYQEWLQRNLYAGRDKDDRKYIRVRQNNSKKVCDGYVNFVNGIKGEQQQYEHGPNSTPP